MDAILIGFITYLVLVIAVGLATYRLNRTGEDYLLAGRRLPMWVATFSERASGESAWLLLGFPGAVLVFGLVQFWTALGCVLGIGLSWCVVAGPLRRETERLGALTIPEYFVRRFGATGQLIRIVATAIVVFFFALYLSAQLNGAGKVLYQTFGIDQTWGKVIGAVIIVAYTVMGGFFAVAWTDLLQGIIMLGTLVILPLVALVEISSGGYSITASLEKAGPDVASWVGGETGWAAVAVVVGGLSWGLGYLGQPHVIIRYMSIRDPGSVRQARVIAFVWAVLAFGGAFLIGLTGLALVGKAPAGDPEQLMPFMAKFLLPSWVAGIFISGAVAAMMSTADSQLLVTTSAVAEDLLHRGIRPNLDHRKMVRVSRLTAFAVGGIAFLLALPEDSVIYTMVSYAWSGLGASFGPAIVFSLYWKRTTGAAVIAGMLTGSISTIVWFYLKIGDVAVDDVISVRFVSFVLATLAVWLVSLATAPPPEPEAPSS